MSASAVVKLDIADPISHDICRKIADPISHDIFGKLSALKRIELTH